MMYLSFAVVVALALKVTTADLVHGKFLTTVFAGFKRPPFFFYLTTLNLTYTIDV